MVQAKMDYCGRGIIWPGVTWLVGLCIILNCGGSQAQGTGATTSALSILQQAPKVRLDDGPVAPAPGPGRAVPPGAHTSGMPGQSPLQIQPVPEYPPVTAPVQPYVGGPPLMQTPPPYSGASTTRPSNAAVAERDEEDDDASERKPGRVRGIIRAIPFIGKRIAGSEEDDTISEPEERTSERQPELYADEPVEQMPGIERAVERPERVPEPPPGSGRDIPSYGYPVIPRDTPSMGIAPDILYPADGTANSSTAAPEPIGTINPNSMLSIKPERPLEQPTTSPAQVVPGVTPGARKEPAVANEPPPTRLDLDATPEIETAPTVDVDTDTPKPASITVTTPAAAEPTFTPVPMAATTLTTPTLQPNDLGMPNPAFEQNDVIRAEYTEAIKAGRDGDYTGAALMFKEYAENHPSSGLAPRAAFLAALLEPDPVRAEEAHALLREHHSKSRYLKELEKRTEGRLPARATPTPDPNETPLQTAMRLESELTEAVGIPEREVPLRLRLGQTYMTLEEYERALEVMRPARDLALGRAEEPEILVLISECLIATRRTEQAAALLGEMLQKYPNVPLRPRAQYDLGLISEATGNYARARAIYNEVHQQWPDTAEGQHALQRLKDLAQLSE